VKHGGEINYELGGRKRGGALYSDYQESFGERETNQVGAVERNTLTKVGG